MTIANRGPVFSAIALRPALLSLQLVLLFSMRCVFVQETNQEVPGWLQGMGARAPSFGGGKRRGGGGNRFGGQDYRRESGNHRETCLLCVDVSYSWAVQLPCTHLFHVYLHVR